MEDSAKPHASPSTVNEEEEATLLTPAIDPNNQDTKTVLINMASHLQLILNEVKTVSKKQNSLSQQVQNLNSKVDKEIQGVNAKVENIQKQCDSTKELMTKNNAVISALQQQANNLDRINKEKNLRLIGIQERADEDPKSIVENILRENFNMPNVEVEDAWRAGKKQDMKHGRQYPRHICFRLLRITDRRKILREKSKAFNRTH